MPHYPKLEEREMPTPPGWKGAIGVGVVVMGMAMGTGELIMWPHLIVKHGLGLLWLALVGITLQYFINQEVARHSLATGESFFTTSGRVIKWVPVFWLFSAVLLYVWPGWASALGTILSELFGFGNYLIWSWLSLALILILTFKGRVAYTMLEKSLKVIVPLFLFLLVLISVRNFTPELLKEAWSGLLNFGWLPADVDYKVLLGAIVFSGAGGMLNLCVSLWYRDKQAGMGKYVGRITNPVTGKPEAVVASGFTFSTTQENLSRFRGWLRYVVVDQGIIFWLLGLISLILLSVNAYAVLAPLGLVPEGNQVAVVQSEIFGREWGILGEKIYLIMAYLMLFSVMWTVYDALTRIVTDIIHTNSRVGPLVKVFHWLEPLSVNHLYYGLIVIFVLLGALLLPFNQPMGFLVTSSVLGGLVMALYTPFLFYLNNWKLPREIRPGLLANFFLILASAFYIYFSVFIILSYF